MAKGEKAKKFRGANRTHGAGRKARRGAGLRGGKGRAGANKHRFLQLQVLGGKHAHMAARPWGRKGFTSKSRTPQDTTINVGDLAARFDGKTIDLSEAGYTKLLGSGRISTAVTVKVAKATDGAVAKIEAAGGSVEIVEEATAPSDAPATQSGQAEPAKKADEPKTPEAPEDEPSGDEPSGDERSD